MSRSDLFRELLESTQRSDTLLRELHAEHATLLRYAQHHEGICALEQEGDTSLAAVIIRYLEAEDAKAKEPLLCDYCGVVTENPWHGSGLFKGKERRHIHACDDCRLKLPVHGFQHVWLNTAGDDPDRAGFSDTWQPAEYSSEKRIEDWKTFIAENPDRKSWKLIEYRCLTDENFVFNHYMRLR